MKLLIFVIFLIQLHHDRGVETQGASTTSPSSCCFKQIAPTFYPGSLLSSLVLTGPEAPAGGLASLSSLPASRYILDVCSQPLIRVKIIFLPTKTKNWSATLNTAGTPRLKKNNFEKICHVLSSPARPAAQRKIEF